MVQNKLKDEQSLYLRQHQNHRVDWWPYSEQALQKAKELNRPILLSIGYSTCHWCHVMANESFADQETADYLNNYFICIKVDKEEHPDIDNYYQQACQLFSGNGGWPLNAFLLPDTKPFFVGTYFPKEKMGEGPKFMELLQELVRAYNEEQEQVKENAKQITESLELGIKPQQEIKISGHFPHPMSIFEALKEHHDFDHGGVKGAPKFPHFSFYEWASEQILEGMLEKEAGDYVVKTIDGMLFGGVYDHARGGFHRYSTDDKFLVPHFEKMLYDQAGFLSFLAKASKFYQAPHVFDAIMDTLEYLEKEMLSDTGYFFSAQDADSEGVEGLYFTFSEQEFEEIINRASDDSDDLTGQMDYWKKVFQISPQGNFAHGLNIISIDSTYKEELFTQDKWSQLRRIRKEILSTRKMRIPPATDNKGIVSWNALTITALADVMQYCPVDVVKFKANDLLKKSLEGFFKTFISRNGEGKVKLIHSTTREDNISFLEDYALFAQSQLRVFEVTGNEVFKNNFKDTLNYIIEEFFNGERLLTRSLASQEFRPYPNQEYTPFDNSFKSAASVVHGLIKKAKVLFYDTDLGDKLDVSLEWLKQMSLMNPMLSGEALRVHTYPDQIYRKLELPHAWLQESEYIFFIGNLMGRFILDYHQDKEDQWQICTIEKCELKGNGLKEFIAALTPSDNDA